MKICAITAGIKKYKLIRRRSMINSIVKKYKSNTIEFLNSKALIDSYISHDKFVSINNVLREHSEIKTSVQYIKTMETYCVSCEKNTANENSSVNKTKQSGLMLLSNCAVSGKKK